jgi:carboxypeptidase Q
MTTAIRLLQASVLCLLCTAGLHPQTTAGTAQPKPYEADGRSILGEGLRSLGAYDMLTELLRGGPRLSGSQNAAKAVEWGRRTMEELGFQNVHLEPVMVPHWVRGETEKAWITGSNIPLTVCALGGSIATPSGGITAGIVEVHTFEELHALGDGAKGKIIFFNRPMDRSLPQTFQAYGGAVDQRSQGAVEAAKAGGVAAIVRSMTMREDDKPHTGAMGYAEGVRKVPSAAVSTIGAEVLHRELAHDKNISVHLELSAETLPDVESANVVGEITGSSNPSEVIVIGGHLDSWDKGQGAHDDGSGCVQTLEALRLLHKLGLKPKRTIRAVLFMNEENGLRGGIGYAAKERPDEKHLAAMESDMGGFSPVGFGVQADSEIFEKVSRWAYLFSAFDADHIRKGGGGSDISPLGQKGVPMFALEVDCQRYFDYHHSDNDVLEAVNPRELELGSISLALMSYMIAQEGL